MLRNSLDSRIHNQKGMTLVEIMIVIAIIGGLMATLGTVVFGKLGKARVSQAKMQLQEISKALEIYSTDCGAFPNNENGLNALIEAPGDCENWGPESYIKGNKLLKDPWQSDIIYELNGSTFKLISLGADKKEGGTGNDNDIDSTEL